jgi:hypothetical protein
VNSVLAAREVSYLRFDFEHATVEVNDCREWRLTAVPGREDPVSQAWVESLRLAQACDRHSPGADTLELLAAVRLSLREGRPVSRGQTDRSTEEFPETSGD